MTMSEITGNNHPALRDFREVILLSGFSGATVALIRDGARSFVRKVSNAVGGNDALKEQAYRQKALACLVEGCAGMPEVYEEGECDGFYYFDMQFIQSRDATNFLSFCSFDDVCEFADGVERLMERLAASPPVTAPPLIPVKQLLDEKLAQIATKTGERHAKTLAPLLEAVSMMDQLTADPKPTAVHGDLTFENILVDRRGRFWLIDTIPSPFDHYWLDWSKLFQECEGLWHVHRGRQLARGVTWWLRQRFHDAATRLDPDYPLRHFVLLGLTFARILPYSRTDEDHAFVGRRVQECGRAALELFNQR